LELAGRDDTYPRCTYSLIIRGRVDRAVPIGMQKMSSKGFYRPVVMFTEHHPRKRRDYWECSVMILMRGFI
jgi:hypothetical protein